MNQFCIAIQVIENIKQKGGNLYRMWINLQCLNVWFFWQIKLSGSQQTCKYSLCKISNSSEGAENNLLALNVNDFFSPAKCDKTTNNFYETDV